MLTLFAVDSAAQELPLIMAVVAFSFLRNSFAPFIDHYFGKTFSVQAAWRSAAFIFAWRNIGPVGATGIRVVIVRQWDNLDGFLWYFNRRCFNS